MIWPAIALIAAIVVAVVVGAVLLHKALTDSRADADKNFGTNPVGCPTQGCPLVKWVWDDPHTKDRRQYVNLPADWDPAKNGTAVELVGHVEPRKSGETVTFSIIPNAGNEPDTGEINYRHLFGVIEELGWKGWIGAEYRPRGDTVAGLGWMKTLTG